MVSEMSFTVGLFLIPLALGLLARIVGLSHVHVQIVALGCIGLEIGGLGYLGMAFEPDITRLQLAAAILLTGLCATFGQGRFNKSSTVLSTTLMVLGLSLGALLAPSPFHRVFLLGLFGLAAFTVMTSESSAKVRSLSLIHFGLAILCILTSFFAGHTPNMWIGLFLAVTLLPLVPFHLPFLSMIGAGKGMLSAFWVVVWIALGLAELHSLENPLSGNQLLIVQVIALVSGCYASLKCLVENRIPQFIAYSAVAQLALLWVIHQVFLDFSKSGIPFGLALAFVMSGLLGIYAFLQQRYGSHELGKFPGLAITMPRLGILMILLISFALLLPIFPISTGLIAMPTVDQSDKPLSIILLTFSVVWFLGSWYFSHLLHQTAFGTPRSNIPYSDLRALETGALAVLVVGASYSGFFL